MKKNIDVKTLKRKVMKVIHHKMPMIEAIYKVCVGMKLIRNIRERYGEDVHILLVRGATGDTYIQLRMLNNWLKENNIQRYVLVGDAVGMESLMKLFLPHNYISISGYRSECVEKVYMLCGGEKLKITLTFPWTYSLYFNRCRLRMTETFNFMDTYKWYVFGLKEDVYMEPVKFPGISNEIMNKLHDMSFHKGKTVIIAPEANSVTQIPVEFWNIITGKLEKKGYKVFINTKKKNNYNTKSVFFDYSEMAAVLEYAGYFIGIRSGLCDIISTVKCKKIILYPEKKESDYNEHRSEIDFCGLRNMGLVEDKEIVELETALIRNITENQYKIDEREETRILIDKIVMSMEGL